MTEEIKDGQATGVRRRWESCEPPQGYRNRNGVYRAWQHTKLPDTLLIECPRSEYPWREYGEWVLLSGGMFVARYHYYGRKLKRPPTAWANKQLA